jgi:5-methylcytosine-specific restriction protein A
MHMLKSRIGSVDIRSAKPPAKEADAELLTPLHRAFRAAVLKRAGYRCERCGRSGCRLFADHVIERADGGALHDPNNGRCLCGSCHTRKTNKQKASRFGLLGA